MKRTLLLFLCALLLTAILTVAHAAGDADEISLGEYPVEIKYLTDEKAVIAANLPSASADGALMLCLKVSGTKPVSDLREAAREATLRTPDGTVLPLREFAPLSEDEAIDAFCLIFDAVKGVKPWAYTLTTGGGEYGLLIPWLNGLHEYALQENGGSYEQDFSGKWLIAVWGRRSDSWPDISLTGEADWLFDGINPERLASSVEEADKIILIYPKYSYQGNYSFAGVVNIVSGYKTYTKVCLYGTNDRHLSKADSAFVRNPPSSVSVTVRNGIASPASFDGAFEYEEVLAQLAERSMEPVATPVPGNKALYDQAVLMIKDGRYFSAQQAFIESQYGSWEAYAAACVQSWPRNGEIWHNDSVTGTGVSLTVKVNAAADTAYFLRIYKSGGTPVSSLFIGGTGEVTVRLPGGTYMMKDGSGKTWYGEKEAFGSHGSYETMTFDSNGGETVRLESGGSYTLTINVKEADPNADSVGAEYESWENFVQ